MLSAVFGIVFYYYYYFRWKKILMIKSEICNSILKKVKLYKFTVFLFVAFCCCCCWAILLLLRSWKTYHFHTLLVYFSWKFYSNTFLFTNNNIKWTFFKRESLNFSSLPVNQPKQNFLALLEMLDRTYVFLCSSFN